MAANVRTTVTLPASLLEKIDCAVREGHARSRNQWLTRAAQRELRRQRDAEIAASFKRMAADADYHREMAELDKEFEATDRAEWLALDREYGPYPADD